MSELVDIEYLDETFEVTEEALKFLQSLSVDKQKEQFEKMYLGVKQSRKDKEIKIEKSNDAKRILSSFDPKIEVDPYSPQQTEIPGLGKGPREPFIASALMIPEEDLDTTSGLSYGVRSRLSLLASPEARKVFLENTTGGKLETLEINGRPEDYIRYPDGKVVQVDEKGFRPRDAGDMMGEVLPFGAEVGATLAVIKAAVPTGGASLLTLGTVGPAAGAAAREFQSVIAQEGIPFMFEGLAPEAQVDFTDSLGRASKEFAVSSVLEIGLLGVGKFAYKPKAISKTLGAEVADQSAKSAKSFNKQYEFEIESGGLSRVTEAPMVKDDFEFLIGSRPESMAIPVERVGTNIKNVPDVIYGTERLAKKEAADTVVRNADRLEKAVVQAEKSGIQQVDLLVGETNSGLARLKEFALGGGTPRQAAERASFVSAEIVEQTARSIKQESDKLYGKVFKSAAEEEAGIPIKDLVQVVRGKTITSEGQKKLAPKNVDTVINYFFDEVIQKYGFKNINELKDSDFWKNNSLVSFADLDRFYKINKQAFDTSATSKNLSARDLDQRLNKLRKKVASKSQGTKNALEEADGFYNETYVPYKNNVYSKFFGNEAFGLQNPEIGNAGIISILKGDNPLQSIQNIKSARKNIDRFSGPNSEARRMFDQSLRYQLLYKTGFLGEVGTVPNGIIGHEKFLFDEVFGPNMSNTVQSLSKDARALNLEIDAKTSQQILQKYVKEGNIEGSKYKNSVLNSLKKIEDAKDLEAQNLFNTKSAFEVIQGDLDGAGRLIIKKKTNTDSVHNFMKELKPIEKKYFRRATLAALIDKYGAPDGDGLLFNGKKVLEVIESNPSKYYGENGIFGPDGRKKLKPFLELADTYNLDIKKASRTTLGQVSYGNRIIWNAADPGSPMIITNLLSNLSPTALKNRIKSRIMATAYLTDSFDKKSVKGYLARRGNFNFNYDEEVINQVVRDMLVKEDGIEFLLGYDDELRATMVEFLGGSGQESSQNQKTFIRESILDRQ